MVTMATSGSHTYMYLPLNAIKNERLLWQSPGSNVAERQSPGPFC